MKKFICKEMRMNGGCDEVFEGETAMDIAKQNGAHWMSTTDDAHKAGREMMTAGPDEKAKKEWWDWFNAEWEKRGEV